MKRNAAASFALVFVAATASAPLPAIAGQPTRLVDAFDVTFTSRFWSGQCGVPVTIRKVGTQATLLFRDAQGMVVAEFDISPGFKTIVSSPTTGKSFTYTSPDPTRYLYPEGVYIGAPVTFRETGVGGFAAPGLPYAGPRWAFGEVAFITPDGVPITDVTGTTESHGNGVTRDEAIAARCAFLNP